MATVSMSTLDSVLKYDYLGPIREQINNATPFLAELKKSSKEVVGKSVYLPLHYGRNSGVGARGTSGTATLPTAGTQLYKESIFLTKDIYGSIEISGKTIRATRNDKGAFLRAVASETEGITKDVGVDIDRQLVMSDTTGQLTLTNGSDTSAVVTVDSTQYLEEGMVIDVGADTSKTIASIDSETQITLSASITWANDEVIKRAGVTSGDELNGLDLFCRTTGAVQGLNPATSGQEWWKAQVFGTSGSPVPLTEIDMLDVCDDISKKGGSVDFLLGSYKFRTAFFNLLQDQKRFGEVNKSMKLKGGFNALVWSAGEKDIPLVVNRFVQSSSTETRAYFLSKGDLGLYRMADFEWMEEDGAILARQTGSGKKEVYEGTLVCDMEFGTNARNRMGVLQGIQTV